MIIDCHGHYTTAPAPVPEFRKQQLAAFKAKTTAPSKAGLVVSDDQIRESLENNQLKLQRERGIDLALFSPGAGKMAHHQGDAEVSRIWTEISNDLVARACGLYPESFIGVCQLPQSPGVSTENCVRELERCINDLGFVACNLNPDPTGGFWTDPPLDDRHWYPLFEKLVELDVPAMIHVASSCNPHFHGTGVHYLNGDTTAFMQMLTSDLFKNFPTLKIVIPHGGGAVPYHWGRYRAIAQGMKLPPLEELLRNIYFDTCVYHQPGVDLLTKVVPVENVLFASEMVGAGKGIDPLTGYGFDDTKRYIDAVPWLTDDDRYKIYEGNVRRVYTRLDAILKSREPA